MAVPPKFTCSSPNPQCDFGVKPLGDNQMKWQDGTLSLRRDMKARSFYHMRTRQTLERGSHKPRGIKDRQESTERQRKVLPQSLPWEHSPATSLISGSRRQNHKTGDVGYLKPFRWWFVLATLGNWEHWCQQVVCCCNKYLRLETQRWGRVEAGRLLRCALEKATNAGGTDKGDARKSSENGELEWQLFREHINNHQQAMGDKGLLPTPDKKWGTCFGQWRKSDCYKVAKNLSSVLWKTEGTNERDS